MGIDNKYHIFLIQRIVPDYRLPFFKKLSGSSIVDLTLVFGEALKTTALQNASISSEINVEIVNNYFYGDKEAIVIQRGCLKALNKKRIDVVIAEFNPRIITNVINFFYAKLKRLPFIWWGHGVGPKSNYVKLLIRLVLISFADAVIFYEYDQAEEFKKRGVDPNKVFVAPNSIDTEKIDPLCTPWKQGQRNRILYVGRLIPEKKIDILIRGFACARPNLPENTCLTIIGSGPERARLEKIAYCWDLGQSVEFVDKVFDEERLSSYFNSACLSISPGYVGLQAIHSLAYGVPMVVSKDEPHSPEIAVLKENENCLFFKTDNIEDLADKIEELVNDPNRLNDFSLNSSKSVREKFSLTTMVQSFEKAIEYVLNRNKKSKLPPVKESLAHS